MNSCFEIRVSAMKSWIWIRVIPNSSIYWSLIVLGLNLGQTILRAASKCWLVTKAGGGYPISTEQSILFCAGFQPSLPNGLWIGKTYGPELGIALKKNSDRWAISKLNTILENNLVPRSKGHFRTIRCIEWESERFDGRPKGRCYPFDLPKQWFRGKNPQVLNFSVLISYMKLPGRRANAPKLHFVFRSLLTYVSWGWQIVRKY
jgi:hypothetical protein